VDTKIIKELAELIDSYHSGIELILEYGNEKITLRSSGNKKKENINQTIWNKTAKNEIEDIDVESKIYSSFVGYVNYAKDGKRYAEDGQIAEKGTLLCKVEPFGREVRAGHKLKVLQPFFEEGDSVEYNDPLFMIEKIE